MVGNVGIVIIMSALLYCIVYQLSLCMYRPTHNCNHQAMRWTGLGGEGTNMITRLLQTRSVFPMAYGQP